MNRLIFWGSVLPIYAIIASATLPALAGDADDVVFLKDGGRLRGLIFEEDPKSGVILRLPDGKTRSIPRKSIDRVEYGHHPDVPLAGQPESPKISGLGGVHVDTTEPGRIFVDDADAGLSPATVLNISPGKHRVRVEFDAGGTATQAVFVDAGDTKHLRLEPTALRRFAKFRQGWHLGAEAGFAMRINFSGFGKLGATTAFIANYGITSAIDFRANIVAEPSGLDGLFFPIVARGSFIFHMGSVYTMGLGFEAGAAIAQYRGGTGLFGYFGPHCSLVGFQFGEKREVELRLVHGLGLITGGPAESSITFEQNNALTFGYLFL